MLPADVLRQVRRLHLRARRVVQTLLGGEYHSAFKGAGLSFEEVREYQPGDDVRTIDWNVTARMGQPFIKRFVEERELTMILAVDVSASQRFGTRLLSKRAVAAEIAALLALCAVSNNDLIAVRTSDPREAEWPAVGLVRLEDLETGRQVVVDTSSRAVREGFAARARDRAAAFTKLCRGAQADLIEAGTDGGHFDAL